MDKADDNSVLNELLEDDDDILNNLIEILGHFFKLHTATYLSIFEQQILSIFITYSNYNNNHPVSLQILSICMLDDAIEYGLGGLCLNNSTDKMSIDDNAGQVLLSYLPQLFNIFEHNMLSSDDNTLKQCSIYGIAQIIRVVAPSLVIPHLPNIFVACIQMIRDFQLAAATKRG